MAVQTQCPSNFVLPDFRNRSRTVLGNENWSSLSPLINQNTFLNEFPIQPPTAGGSSQLRFFNQLTGPNHGLPTQLNPVILNELSENEIAGDLFGSRKKARKAEDLVSQRQQPQHHHQLLTVPEFQLSNGPGSVVNPQSTGVSTGLRLTFDDDRLHSSSPPSSSGRGDAVKNYPTVMREDLSSQLQQQREEIEQLLKLQGEQVRQLLEEKRQRHSRQLIAAIQEGLARRLGEKDLEIERVKRQNQDLIQRVTQLNSESHHWQNKLRASDAILNALRSNLHQAQQAVVLSRELSKEGCGDSEADDCASSHQDNRDDAHARTFNENRELREQRTCRVCRCNDVSILLLPCKHLCLCKECETQLDACPLCRTLKNASVQVYMS